jgi:hypothetical protein
MLTPTKSNYDKGLTGAMSKPGLDLTAGTPTKPSGLSPQASRSGNAAYQRLAEAGLQGIS